jgi:hypothetical protein
VGGGGGGGAGAGRGGCVGAGVVTGLVGAVGTTGGLSPAGGVSTAFPPGDARPEVRCAGGVDSSGHTTIASLAETWIGGVGASGGGPGARGCPSGAAATESLFAGGMTGGAGMTGRDGDLVDGPIGNWVPGNSLSSGHESGRGASAEMRRPCAVQAVTVAANPRESRRRTIAPLRLGRSGPRGGGAATSSSNRRRLGSRGGVDEAAR